MLDIKKIKENLSLDDYDKIFGELGIPVMSRSNDVWKLKFMCHCISPDDYWVTDKNNEPYEIEKTELTNANNS